MSLVVLLLLLALVLTLMSRTKTITKMASGGAGFPKRFGVDCRIAAKHLRGWVGFLKRCSTHPAASRRRKDLKKWCRCCVERNKLTDEFLKEYSEDLDRIDGLINRLVEEGKLEDLRQLQAAIDLMWDWVHPAIHREGVHFFDLGLPA